MLNSFVNIVFAGAQLPKGHQVEIPATLLIRERSASSARACSSGSQGAHLLFAKYLPCHIIHFQLGSVV